MDKIFSSLQKNAKIEDVSMNNYRWFSIIKNGRRFTSKISIDEDNLRWVCAALKHASMWGQGDTVGNGAGELNGKNNHITAPAPLSSLASTARKGGLANNILIPS
ncbi:hypothetical protein HAX54_046439 [Datura stramonium]|uniref:Uncharacterized protein n=1 Tax=Datura stramonium TaxID=4076 RepID=A0ABS8WIW9_DATST|nr:hypothetical protein [Datura stramonium]